MLLSLVSSLCSSLCLNQIFYSLSLPCPLCPLMLAAVPHMFSLFGFCISLFAFLSFYIFLVRALLKFPIASVKKNMIKVLHNWLFIMLSIFPLFVSISLSAPAMQHLVLQPAALTQHHLTNRKHSGLCSCSHESVQPAGHYSHIRSVCKGGCNTWRQPNNISWDKQCPYGVSDTPRSMCCTSEWCFIFMLMVEFWTCNPAATYQWKLKLYDFTK